MADRSLIFPSDEFRSRCARLQREMEHQNLAALLLTTPPDIFYITGFLTRFWESPARPWFVVVPASGDPVAVIPSIGADLMGRTWIEDIRTWNAPNPEDDGVSLLRGTLSEQAGADGRIGLPMGLETQLRMPLGDYERLARSFGGHRFVDGTNALQRAREIKSKATVEKIRATCTSAGRAFARVPEIARVGVPLDQVFRDFQCVLLDEGADWVSYLAGAAAQDGYGDVISPAEPTPLAAGDVLMLDTGAVKDGYFCDFDRNFAIGPASDTARRAHEALWNATEQLLTEIRPGMLALDAHRILSAALLDHGVTPGGGRMGHGLGEALTEWPSFTSHDRTELREGMVLAIEPSVVVGPGKLMVHEENVVLRADGAELLSPRAPSDLPEIGI